MQTTELVSQDGWLWQMYRLGARWVHHPTDENEAQLHLLIADYRRFYESRKLREEVDPHERVMDYV